VSTLTDQASTIYYLASILRDLGETLCQISIPSAHVLHRSCTDASCRLGDKSQGPQVAADQIGGGDVMGTVLADFKRILGNDPVLVPSSTGDLPSWHTQFNTGGIRTDFSAILMLSAIGVGGSGQADVFINDKFVGTITNTQPDMFIMQMIIIDKPKEAKFQGSDGDDNEIAIKHVSQSFRIKDIVCFFHQES
jgi:hypothetical protein